MSPPVMSSILVFAALCCSATRASAFEGEQVERSGWLSIAQLNNAPNKASNTAPNNAPNIAPNNAPITAARTAKFAGKGATKVAAKLESSVDPAAVPTSAGSPVGVADAMIRKKVADTIAALRAQPIRLSQSPRRIEVAASPVKHSWLSVIYKKNMVASGLGTQMLSDKRILAGFLEREMGSRAFVYYPKTLGLKEFLVKHRLLSSDGSISGDGEQIELALHSEFPAGFHVRPAVGVAPGETGRGFFADSDEFIVELLKPNNRFYSPRHFRRPIKSSILGVVASGEAVVLQENIVGAADARKPLRMRFFQEVRVHTYERRVVSGAVPSRWVQTDLLSETEIARAESFVAHFLSELSPDLLTRQAWGVDVAVMDNGEMRILEVVTNRGKNLQWSSYLEQPRVIGAYARHFEMHYGLRFEGLSGALIRHGYANYFPYWEKRIELARPGLGKVLSYLPPAP